MTQLSAVPALVLRRVYDAPRERVFEAWTDPHLAAQFLGPFGVRAEVEMDPHVGGTYRIIMNLESGEKMLVRGAYKEVRRPSKLVMTWRWGEDRPEDEYDTLLTIELFEHSGGTELVLTHEQFATEQSRTNHENGWTSIMRKLEGFLKIGVSADADTEDGAAYASVHLAASLERVYQALTSSEVTSWWVRPGVFDTREWDGDVRVGATFHASGVGRGQPYALEGEFLEVDKPHKLVHTWKMAGSPAAPSTVTYELTPIDGGTKLSLRHTGLAPAELCINTCAGWETSLFELAKLLGSYERTLEIPARADAVYDALTTLDGLAGWWAPVTGSPNAGGELSFTFGEIEQKVIRVEAAARPSIVTWRVLSSKLHGDEWVGTTITFVITGTSGASTLHMRHEGLTPKLVCYSDCYAGWDYFLQSLRDYVVSGKGTPHGSAR